MIPARLPAARADAVREMAAEAFRAVEGAGMARVDFLLAADGDRIYVNEVNTIPGFTDDQHVREALGGVGTALRARCSSA